MCSVLGIRSSHGLEFYYVYNYFRCFLDFPGSPRAKKIHFEINRYTNAFRELVYLCIKLFMQYIVKVKKDLKERTFIELTQICTISLFPMI